MPLPQRKVDVTESKPVYLRGQHLILHPALIKRVFGEEDAVAMVYYPQRRKLMLAPISNKLFRMAHKGHQQFMLKQTAGGREFAVALHSILYDHEIDQTNRPLDHEVSDKMKILTISL